MAYRVDFGTVRDVQRTPVGGLRVNAAVTRSGVLTYKDTNGKEWRELRPPEEVFKADSLATLPDAAVTDGHPTALVTPDTHREVSRGHVAGAATREQDLVLTPLAVNDGALVRAVEAGERKDCSAGYTCDLEDSPGQFNGQAYDRVQRNIRYNHVALLPPGHGRAGDRVSLRMDDSAQQVMRLDAADPKEKETTVKTITLFGKTYRLDDAGDMAAMQNDVPAQVSKKDADNAALAAKLDAVQTALMDAFGTIANLKAAMDLASEGSAADGAEDDANATEPAPEEVLDAAKARRLIARAVAPGAKLKGMRADAVKALVIASIDKLAGVRAEEMSKVRADALKVLAADDIKGKDVAEIRKLALAKLAPEVKLDSLDAKMIAGMFEVAIATAKPAATTDRNDDLASLNVELNSPRTNAGKGSLESRYDEMNKELFDRGRKPISAAAGSK